MSEKENKINRVLFLLFILFFLIDASIPPWAIGSTLYVICLMVALRSSSHKKVYVAALISSVLILISLVVNHLDTQPLRIITNQIIVIALIWVTTFLGVQYRKRLEINNYLAAIIDFSNDIIFGQDLQGNITSWNKTAEEAYGYSFKEMLNHPVKQIIPEAKWFEFDGLLQKVRQGERIKDFETIHRRKDGVLIHVLLTLSPIRSSLGDIAGISSIVQDIAEQKKSEQKMRELTEAKLKLISMVSHEIRSPITSIQQSINIVLGKSSENLNVEQRDFLDVARRNVDRLARLINNVLDFQKLQTGKVEFVFKEGDINEVVKEAYQTMKLVADQKHLDLKIELDPSLPLVLMDRDKIAQVVTNLLNNAIKFTEVGYIKLVIEKKDGSVHLTVKDTGRGISAQNYTRIFNSFEQVLDPQQRSEGTGLGLSISKEIIERHQGKIWVESEMGEGSVFHVILPLPR